MEEHSSLSRSYSRARLAGKSRGVVTYKLLSQSDYYKSQSSGSTRATINKDSTVGIIGAGVAGLYAAMLLKSLGYTKFEILEANSRTGGRVYTYDFDKGGKEDYFDVGAMRFPCIPIMYRVIGRGMKPPSEGENDFSLVGKLGLRDQLEPYVFSSENSFYYYNGQRKNAPEAMKDDNLQFGDKHNGGKDRGVPDFFAGQPYSTWLDPVYAEYKEALARNFDEGFKKLMESDKYSTRSYLLSVATPKDPETGETIPDHPNFPNSVISWFETLDSASGLYDLAFSESIMDSLDFDYPESDNEWVRFKPGSQILVDKMVESLGECKEGLYLGTRVKKISPEADGKIRLQIANKKDRVYDHVISTLPLSVFRTLDTSECKLSYKKQLALRTLHYDQSVKIGMLFRDRWWEKECGIYGGKSSTDLPIRTIVYPSYGFKEDQNGDKSPGDGSGVVIVSYTWAQDAARIGAIQDQDVLKDLVLSNLASVHNLPKERLSESFIEMKVHDWYKDEYAQGAFALYGPGQFSSLFAAVIQPEVNQRLHFAGEATSVHHAWIVGSLNSAYRTVWEMLDDEQREKLVEMWGTIEEVENPEKTFPDEEVENPEKTFPDVDVPSAPAPAPAIVGESVVSHPPLKTHASVAKARQQPLKSQSDTTYNRKGMLHFPSRI